MADDDVVVAIEPETPKVEAGKEKPAVETAQTDPVADLKAQLDEINARQAATELQRKQAVRETAVERQARVTAEQKVQAAETEITETRLSTVESGLSAAQTEVNAAKSEWISAQEAGDWKRAADAAERLAEAKAKAVRLDEAKSDLEAAKAAPRTRQTEQPRQQVTESSVADRVETFISGPVDAQGNRRAPEAQDWLRKHIDHITDPRKLKKLGAADMDAQAEGLEVNSPEYFSHVEKFLGLTKETLTNGKTPPRRAASAPVAPVNASAGGGTNGGTEVRLSQSEARAATDGTLVWNYDDTSPQKRFKKGDPIGTQEMARRKLAMTAEGRYDPMNFVQQ